MSITILIVVASIGIIAAFVYYAAYAIRSQIFGKTVWHGDKTKNAVALTFDDGPGEDTEAILDILENYRIKATFFMVGRQVEKYPETARRIVREGHEIGNHSFSHPIYLYQMPTATGRELEKTQAAIEKITGIAPKLSRPPCGVRTPAYFAATRNLDLQTVQWTVAGFDWLKISADKIAENVLKKAQPGSIILLHDADSDLRNDRRETVKSLSSIIEGLTAKNLRVAALRELCAESVESSAETNFITRPIKGNSKL